ncbi:MAG TPA: heme-binding protein [Chloroflexota bacterium]|jgi:uncharacterized protein GlcG (DUF336 family)|nr:heme-binding protein [Chloroflexota bacterium]
MGAPLTLDEGLRLLQVCLDKARALNVNVSIAVVDASGLPVCAARMDQAGALTPDIAYGKAFAAAAFKRSGREMGEQWPPGLPMVVAMAVRTGGRFVPQQGSLLLRDGDAVVGAIGVSGAPPHLDEEVAQAGVDAFRR